jgi:hypothetical protein
VPLDDDRLAKASRLLRRKHRLRQVDLPTPRAVAQDVEAGRIGQLRVDQLRKHFSGLGATVRLTAWWEGAALDRLLDAEHAGVVEIVARELDRYLFRTLTEVSFSEYGERGSIDVLGAKEIARVVFVGEAKSEWGSIEETLRRLDVKIRLAPVVAQRIFGWRPDAVAGVLVFPDTRTARRVADRYAATLAASLPARGREVRSWLRQPSGPLRGIWFLSNAELVQHESPKDAQKRSNT